MAGVLLDSSALYAIADRDDKWHKLMASAVEGWTGERVVPVSVLAEACYLLNRHLGVAAERQLLRSLVDGELVLEGLDLQDVERADALLQKYADSNIGFVDASIVAIAERLNIGAIATTDRRHFSLLRPKHRRAFDLVP
jgi:predicted nucleic acid-binding protein